MNGIIPGGGIWGAALRFDIAMAAMTPPASKRGTSMLDNLLRAHTEPFRGIFDQPVPALHEDMKEDRSPGFRVFADRNVRRLSGHPKLGDTPTREIFAIALPVPHDHRDGLEYLSTGRLALILDPGFVQGRRAFTGEIGRVGENGDLEELVKNDLRPSDIASAETAK
jgi:hypothetical protein